MGDFCNGYCFYVKRCYTAIKDSIRSTSNYGRKIAINFIGQMVENKIINKEMEG